MDNFTYAGKTILLIYVLFAFTACSLDYFEQEDSSSTSPEFVFSDANFKRMENNKQSIRMDVAQLEQYSDSGLAFAKNPSFTLFDSEEEVSVIGYCDILSVDTEADEYIFFGDVSVVSYEHDAKIEADNLRWDGKTEVFSGALNEGVSISIGNFSYEEDEEDVGEKETELLIEGTGFSASGLDFSYSFTGPVKGRIIEY